MRWTLTETDGARTYVCVADPGDEAFAALSDFAAEQGLTAATLTAVGAFSRATVGWFDRGRKEYRRIEIGEQCEVLSLLGDIAVGEDGPQVHVHAVLGLSDGGVRGGHLLAGEVWPTLEVVARETPATLRKTSRPDIGLALIDLSQH
jgi:predicted DNA-binding protein with PD1-like motif